MEVDLDPGGADFEAGIGFAARDDAEKPVLVGAMYRAVDRELQVFRRGGGQPVLIGGGRLDADIRSVYPQKGGGVVGLGFVKAHQRAAAVRDEEVARDGVRVGGAEEGQDIKLTQAVVRLIEHDFLIRNAHFEAVFGQRQIHPGGGIGFPEGQGGGQAVLCAQQVGRGLVEPGGGAQARPVGVEVIHCQESLGKAPPGSGHGCQLGFGRAARPDVVPLLVEDFDDESLFVQIQGEAAVFTDQAVGFREGLARGGALDILFDAAEKAGRGVEGTGGARFLLFAPGDPSREQRRGAQDGGD